MTAGAILLIETFTREHFTLRRNGGDRYGEHEREESSGVSHCDFSFFFQTMHIG